MISPEMKLLNPLGGYVRVKNHLNVAHKISWDDMPKYMDFTETYTDYKLYCYLKDDIR